MSTRPAALQAIHPSVLELMRCLLEGAVLRQIPEGWMLCQGSRSSCLCPATVEQLKLHGLLTADRTQAVPTYRLSPDGERAFFAGGYEPRVLTR